MPGSSRKMRGSERALAVLVAVAAGCGGGSATIQAGGLHADVNVDIDEPTVVARERTQRVRRRRVIDATHCPRTGSGVFVLLYDADLGTLEPEVPGSYPVGGQRIVVCVTAPDWRDAYTVTTSDSLELPADQAQSEEFTVGSANDFDAPSESVETRGGREDTETARSSRVCGVSLVATAASYLEAHRSRLLRRLIDVLSGPVGEEEVLELRAIIDDFRYPRFPEMEGEAPPEGNEGPRLQPCSPDALQVEGQDPRCSLEAHVNFTLLPRWLWLADGEWLFDEVAYDNGLCDVRGYSEGDSPPAADANRGLPAELQPAVDALAASLERAFAAADLAETLMRQLERPETVFDLGTFGGNHLAIITLVRHRQTLVLRGGTAHLEWRARRAVRRQEVHAISTFRLEPGFAFSMLRRPEFGTEQTSNGDVVVALRDEGLRLIDPAVFVSFYWCGQDLRVVPWERNCQGHDGDPGWWILAHLPSITVGIPITADLISERASFYVGLLLDWIPYVSVGVGAHIGVAVPTLRDGVLIGDPLDGRNLEELVEERPQISGYFSLSMSIDAFTQLAGFTVEP